MRLFTYHELLQRLLLFQIHTLYFFWQINLSFLTLFIYKSLIIKYLYLSICEVHNDCCHSNSMVLLITDSHLFILMKVYSSHSKNGSETVSEYQETP